MLVETEKRALAVARTATVEATLLLAAKCRPPGALRAKVPPCALLEKMAAQPWVSCPAKPEALQQLLQMPGQG